MSDYCLLIGHPFLAKLIEPPISDRGFAFEQQPTVRNAIKRLRKGRPPVLLITELFPLAFHDRVSELESLLAHRQQAFPETRVIVLSETNNRERVAALSQRFPLDATVSLPLRMPELDQCLGGLLGS